MIEAQRRRPARPLAAPGDHDELDDGEDEEDDGPDDVVAADHERSERLDDLARVGLQQDEARGGYAERLAVERREQKQCREGRDAERLGLVEDNSRIATAADRLVAMRMSSSHVGSGTIIIPTTRMTSAARPISALGRLERRPMESLALATRFMFYRQYNATSS